MMKVSDPIMFGHMVRVYYSEVFTKYDSLFTSLGINPNNGLGDVYDKIKGHPQQAEVEAAISQCYETRPGLAMVDSSKGEIHLQKSNIRVHKNQVSPISMYPVMLLLMPACLVLSEMVGQCGTRMTSWSR